MPAYDEKYIKPKVREFSDGIKPIFLDDVLSYQKKMNIRLALPV